MKKFFAVLICIACVFCLTGCDAAPQKYTDYSFDSFDTVTTITGYEQDKEIFEKNCEQIKALLYEYHKLYTIYNRYEGINNLCVLNAAEGEELVVDKKIIDLLNFSKDMYSLTGGKVNVAMGNLLKIWHDCRKAAENDPETAVLPDENALRTAAESINIDDVVINKEKNSVRLQNGVRLDVGAVAKGYAVEQVALWMEENGMSGYVLNVGGNVRTIGKKADGEGWTVGIENPTGDENEPYLEYLSLYDYSLVTSGSYQRFYVVGGENYHHIIDEETLYPAEYFVSVSVLCRDSGYADALSTALFCMPLDEGKALVEKLDGVEAFWLTKDGEKHYSENFKDFCI